MTKDQNNNGDREIKEKVKEIASNPSFDPSWEQQSSPEADEQRIGKTLQEEREQMKKVLRNTRGKEKPGVDPKKGTWPSLLWPKWKDAEEDQAQPLDDQANRDADPKSK